MMQLFDPSQVWALLVFLAGLVATFIVVSILNFLLKRYIRRLVAVEPRLVTTYTFLNRAVLATVALLGVSSATFAAFPQVGGLVSSIFVAAGFASIVIGLAAQTTLSNFISGMMLASSQPFRIGDAVVFKGDFGFIEDIRLMHTVIRTWDNRRLVVPNAIFQTEVIVNYTRDDATMLVPVFVQVSYESDLDKAMKIMVDVAKRHPECLPIGDLPNAVVMEFAESGINLRLLSRAKDQPTAFMMARDLLRQIKKEFDANGIEIPYPRRYLVMDKRIEDQLSKLVNALHEVLRKSR